jgi:hypothetical protein
LSLAETAPDRRIIVMKKEDVERFEKVAGQIQGIYEEITSLSKKSPSDGVNKFKLQFVNKVIEAANSLLDNKHKPFDDFSVFDEDTLPSNSDVVFILAQYINCMETLRVENIRQLEYTVDWYWVINGKLSSQKTAPPKKLDRR